MTKVDVKAIRSGMALSQEEFARRFGFNLGTLRHWEQGSRSPDKAASTLLTIVKLFPDMVADTVSQR